MTSPSRRTAPSPLPLPSRRGVATRSLSSPSRPHRPAPSPVARARSATRTSPPSSCPAPPTAAPVHRRRHRQRPHRLRSRAPKQRSGQPLHLGERPLHLSTAITSGSGYAVTVFSQPSGQTCTVSGGSGTVGNANVTNVVVSCATNRRPDSRSEARSAGSQPRPGPAATTVPTTSPSRRNGPFTFATALTSGSSYAVTVFSQPPGRPAPSPVARAPSAARTSRASSCPAPPTRRPGSRSEEPSAGSQPPAWSCETTAPTTSPSRRTAPSPLPLPSRPAAATRSRSSPSRPGRPAPSPVARARSATRTSPASRLLRDQPAAPVHRRRHRQRPHRLRSRAPRQRSGQPLHLGERLLHLPHRAHLRQRLLGHRLLRAVRADVHRLRRLGYGRQRERHQRRRLLRHQSATPLHSRRHGQRARSLRPGPAQQRWGRPLRLRERPLHLPHRAHLRQQLLGHGLLPAVRADLHRLRRLGYGRQRERHQRRRLLRHQSATPVHIGGTVSGLAASGLVLATTAGTTSPSRRTAPSPLPLAHVGKQLLGHRLLRQPSGQSCTVSAWHGHGREHERHQRAAQLQPCFTEPADPGAARVVGDQHPRAGTPGERLPSHPSESGRIGNVLVLGDLPTGLLPARPPR